MIAYPLRCVLLLLILLRVNDGQPTARADEPAAFAKRTVPESIAVPPTANRAYRLLILDGAKDSDAKWPLVVYLHGAGAKGSDNAKQTGEVFPRLLASEELRKRFPCFVLVPQCRDGEDSQGRPNNWVKWENQKGTQPTEWRRSEAEPSDQLRAAMASLQDVLATQPVDPTRVSLTGVSMGGSAAWYWSAREPQRFAAVVTACGLSETSNAKPLAKLPIWAFHGSDDPIAPVQRSREMIAALKAAGGTPKFTEFTGAGHGIAERVFTDDNHAVLRWLFEQRKTP